MTGAGSLDPLADPRWERLIDRAPDATIFHHPAWLALLADQYRYPCSAVVVEDGGEVVAGLPIALVASRLTGRRLVALPFSDTCPPLVADGAPGGTAQALAEALGEEQARRGLPLQVRGAVPGVRTTAQHFLTHTVDLRDGLTAVRSQFTPQVRRNARRAEREGVEIELSKDPAALDPFFALHLRTRRRLGVPTQSRRFVRGLGGLLTRDLGFVALARHEGRVIAAAVFLRGGGTLTYKYGASDLAHQGLRPNNLLFDRAIARACKDGLHTFDLGRTDAGQSGLAAFKRSWGAAERPLAYTYLGGSPPAPGPSRAERALAAVIRRSPPAVGGAIGAMLYRHVG